MNNGRIMKITVMAVWTLALGTLVFGGGFVRFLKPSFGFLLLGAAIAMLFMLRMEFSHAGKDEDSGLLRNIILLLPVFMIVLSAGAELDSASFEKRSPSAGLPGTAEYSEEETAISEKNETGLRSVEDTGSKASKTAESKKEPEVSRDEKSIQSGNEQKQDGVIGTERDVQEITKGDSEFPAVDITITELYRFRERLIGKRFAIVGKVVKHIKVREVYGENAWLVYRFVISCCAADAMPASVVVLVDQAFNAENDTWVKATGVFDADIKENINVLLLKNAVIEKTEKPKQEYLW